MPFKKGEKPPEKKQYVEKKDFDTLLDAVNNLASLMTTQVKKTETPEESKQVKEVEKAGPNKYEVDSDREEIAKEIIGEEFLDHTELERKGGGIKFTIVIKLEKSNAPKEYLERVKTDRRTREVGSEGTEGVREWCKLVKSNLNRAR